MAEKARFVFHWCRRDGWTDGEWFPCAVLAQNNGPRLVLACGLGDGAFDESTPGVTIGPRIPSPERLEALEALASKPPFVATGDCEDTMIPVCAYCDKPSWGSNEHDDGCPWKRAQEAKP